MTRKYGPPYNPAHAGDVAARKAAAYGLLRAAVALAVSVGPEHGEEAMECLRTALRECERRDG
jgi:hypothetical protein